MGSKPKQKQEKDEALPFARALGELLGSGPPIGGLTTKLPAVKREKEDSFKQYSGGGMVSTKGNGKATRTKKCKMM